MAQNITLLGASYPSVPAVTLPKTGGGIAAFWDLEEIFPVGELWATEDSTANPATGLGFGTWGKYAPAALTWGDLSNMTWGNIHGVRDGVYVWKRTA